MSIPIVIPWLSVGGNEGAIASVQDGVAGQSLNLNSSTPSLPKAPYNYNKVIRTIRIYHGDDPDNGDVVITGIGSPVDTDGNPTQVLNTISETVTTVQDDFVQSVNVYSQIISVVPQVDISALSVGFGDSGISDYVFLDYNRKQFQTSVQLQFINQAGADINETDVTVYQSLTKPQMPNVQYGNLDNFQPIPAFAVSTGLTLATTNQLGTLLSPVALTWANFKNSHDNTSVYFTVLQQGIT